ncbi:N-acetylmuramoyl-L-alanine amidase AmiC precursor [Serratia rubidaea]|uniref:N-acetylmuramoyl-L-alanine amidase AmiC n=1 Tax=Serratia rubidaea TaxID=61652 RepID=A0A4U9HUU1_SERRU|nr:N-acetylmuramoyl-L-alanine amidase AmiC precursor [Serratia rubidaea]
MLELKQSVSPHMFTPGAVAEYRNRLVLDMYPSKPAPGDDEYDPLLALLEDYNKGDLERTLPAPAQAPQTGKAG